MMEEMHIRRVVDSISERDSSETRTFGICSCGDQEGGVLETRRYKKKARFRLLQLRIIVGYRRSL